MRFGPVAVKDALGTILAHGVPAAGLAKGIVLRDRHVLALSALGTSDVMVARLETRATWEKMTPRCSWLKP
jgi:hypothetical protein